jgi:hypothetical protein
VQDRWFAIKSLKALDSQGWRIQKEQKKTPENPDRMSGFQALLYCYLSVL